MTLIRTRAAEHSRTAQNSSPIRVMPRWTRGEDTEQDVVLMLLADAQWKKPTRLKSPKFIQMTKALPTIASSGTKPQKRESCELSRLSPIMK